MADEKHFRHVKIFPYIGIILNFAHMRAKFSSASRTPAAHPPGGVYGSGTFPAAVRRHHP